MGKGFRLNWISRYRGELLGIAILMVMLFHFAMLHVSFYKGSESTWFMLLNKYYKYVGSGGVDIFVFLSGMGLYYSFSKNNDIMSFYSRRFKRILIPYAIVGGIFWIQVDLFHRGVGFVRLLKDFFYVTFITEGVNHLWFISYIGVMYLIFPLIYKAIYHKHFGKILFLIIFVAAVLIPVALQTNNPDLYKNIDKAIVRTPFFVLGVAAGKPIKEDKAILHIIAIGIIAFCGYCGYFSVLNGFKGPMKRYATGLLAIGILLACVYILRCLDKAKVIRIILRFFGKYSLEFYLLHILLWEYCGETGVPLHRTSRFALMVCACCILAPILSKITEIISRAITWTEKKTS